MFLYLVLYNGDVGVHDDTRGSLQACLRGSTGSVGNFKIRAAGLREAPFVSFKEA